MITDIDAYLKWFAGVNKRAVRDVSALPDEAEGWKPQTGDGENAWGIGQLVGHMATSRMWFTTAYRGGGWTTDQWEEPTETRDQWIDALNASSAHVVENMGGTPADWLTRRVESFDTPGLTFSAWRLLMMMAEHDIHHRSQIDTYAGVMGWPVQQIFGRRAEDVGLAMLRKETAAAAVSQAQAPTAAAAGTVTLGDLTVNRLGFGAMQVTGPGIWGPPADPDECQAVLRRLLDLDVNFIDTADAYGPNVSEELIAEALHPYPDGLVIGTKAGLVRPGPGEWTPDGRPEHLREAVDGSLKAAQA